MSSLNFSQETQARVGLQRNANGDANGTSLGAEGLLASTSRAASTMPQGQRPMTAVNEYLVGTQLDEALATGQDISIFWPFSEGDIKDWKQAEAIW